MSNSAESSQAAQAPKCENPGSQNNPGQRPPRLPGRAIAWCVLIACLGFSWNLYSSSGSDDQDGINYECAAHSMMNNHSYMRWRFPYASLSESGPVFNGYFPYPNYAYIFTVGVLGKVRGVWDVSNGLIVSFIFNILVTLAAATLMYRLSRDALLTALFAIALQAAPIFRQTSVLPMTELCLIFFFTLSLMQAMEGRLFLSGVLLGVGYLFRGQALLFVPYLPLVWLGCRSVKSYVKGGFLAGVGFLPFFLFVWGMKYVLARGLPTHDFYSNLALSRVLPNLIKPEAISAMLHFSAGVIAEHSLLFVPVLILLVVPGRLSPISQRLTLIAFLNIAETVILWSPDGLVPYRLLVHFVPLLLVVLYLEFTSRKRRFASGLVLTGLILLFPVQDIPDLVKKGSATQLADVKRVVFRYQDLDRAIFAKEGNAIASTDFALTHLYDGRAMPITLPEVNTFLVGNFNRRIDIVLVSARQGRDAVYKSWMSAPAVLMDHKGVTFIQAPTPSPDYLRVYMRDDLYRAYQAGKPGLPPAPEPVATPAVATAPTTNTAAAIPVNPLFTEGWGTVSSYSDGRIKLTVDKGKSILIMLAEDSPTKGDYVGITRSFPTEAGKSYEIRSLIEDSYPNNFPGRLAEQIYVNGKPVWSHDIGEGRFVGNMAVQKTITAEGPKTEISIQLRAVGTIDPWHWGLQSLRVVDFEFKPVVH